MRLAGEHPYYLVRFQKRVLLTHKKCLKLRYPNIIKKGVCNDKNTIHAWNMFRTSLGNKNGAEIISVYLVMSSVSSLEICLILIYDLKIFSHYRSQNPEPRGDIMVKLYVNKDNEYCRIIRYHARI